MKSVTLTFEEIRAVAHLFRMNGWITYEQYDHIDKEIEKREHPLSETKTYMRFTPMTADEQRQQEAFESRQRS